jgi:hypothetical protein
LYKVCEHLDGVIFTPSSLRDARGRILIDAAGQTDDDAVMPKVKATVTIDRTEASDDDTEDDEQEPVPPTAARVARRALALTAVCARATLELDAPHLEEPDSHRQRMLEWVQELGIGDELEPNEWKVLQRPVGTLDERSFIDSMWRVEGLVVLAWALKQYQLPADDELVIPPELYQAMGLFDADAGRLLLSAPQLRGTDELAAMQTHLLMLHWRLRDYSLRPQAMNFVEFSQSNWWHPFDVSSFRIVDHDLAIGDVAIDEADDDEVGRVSSIAMERHLAVNWLMGYSDVYSETDTST